MAITVVKRDCTEVEFNKQKIYNAIMKAMPFGEGEKPTIAQKIADEIEEELSNQEEIEIYDIEKMVFDKLISHRQRNTARAYEGYRKVKEIQRYIQNSTDIEILDLLNGENEELNKENSNKNAQLVTTIRDYIAGVVSKDFTNRVLLPPQVVQAHNEGILHFHDADYFIQPTNNCCLINAKDMLENGTNINGVHIDTPKRFTTACTVMTQIITAVASSQYGGTSVTLTHLAPYVRKSKEEITSKYDKYKILNLFPFRIIKKKLIKEDLQKEIRDGVQTFNYQINSMSTTNGQAPFITVFMYLNEDIEYKEEVAMIIEEFLKQRIQGMKNKKGIPITQSFPKLIYVLQEDNIVEGSQYWYLTKLSARCSAKRLVPDYISEKKMKELKEENCFPSINKICA